MGKKAPAAPDPYKTAAAQGGMNMDTAITQQFLNGGTQVNPWGTVATDVTGNNTETEALRFRTFAEVKDGGGSLGSDHGHNTLSNQKTFKIRYRADWVLNTKWKIKYFGKLYGITSIERINEKRFNWLIRAEG